MALHSAVEQNPCCTCALSDLFDSFNDSRERNERLVAALQHAVEASPNNPLARFLLGRQLARSAERLYQAHQEFVAALDHGGNEIEIWRALGPMILASYKETQCARNALSSALRKTRGRLPSIWNSIAWSIHMQKRGDLNEYATSLAHRAVRAEPDNWAFRHTLASVLVDNGELDYAIAITKDLVIDWSDGRLQDFISICIDIAKTQKSADLLAILESVDGRDVLEPLIAALRLHQGKPVNVAEEVRQVAQDLVLQIESAGLDDTHGA